MKLLRFGPLGQEKPGLLDPDGNIRDLSGVISDFDARTLSPEGLSELAAIDLSRLSIVSGKPRLGAPSGQRTRVNGT